MLKPSKIAFLDRDGTLNFDPGYLNDPSLLRLIPGVCEGLALLRKSGFRLVVVSNQSGIGRGLIAPQTLTQIHDKMNELLLRDANLQIDEYRICPHHPELQCDCRKPSPKLLFDTAADYGVALEDCVMIGDKQSDIEAGLNARCRFSVQVLTGAGQEETAKRSPHARSPDYIAEDLFVAARWLIENWG